MEPCSFSDVLIGVSVPPSPVPFFTLRLLHVPNSGAASFRECCLHSSERLTQNDKSYLERVSVIYVTKFVPKLTAPVQQQRLDMM